MTIPPFVGAADSSATSGVSAAVTIPAHSSGDRLDVLIGTTINSTPATAINTPAGWTKGRDVEAGDASAIRLTHFYKAGDGVESSVAITLSGGVSFGFGATCIVHSGAVTDAVNIDGFTAQESGVDITSPSVTTTVDDVAIIQAFVFDDDASTEADVDSDPGFNGTLRGFEKIALPGNGLAMAVSTASQAIAGASSSCVWSTNVSSNAGVAFTIAFAPAAAGGGGGPPAPAPTAAEIADALAGRFGPVSLRLRYQQRDHDFVLQADLSNAVVAASIELDNHRSIIRTARFTIDADAMPAGFDPANDHIAIILELLVGGAFEPIPMGLFHLDVPKEIHESDGREIWEVEASDMTTHLLQNRTEAPYTVAAGTNYVTAIETILDLLDLNHNLPAVALTTPVAFTWGPGVPFYDIVRDLAFAMNRFMPWPDERGVFTTIERVDPSSVTPNYSPSTTVEPRMIREPFEKSEDRTRWANRIVSLIDNPLRAPEFSLRVNDDPTSPISTVTTGATITEELNGSRVADTPTNEAIVEYEIADRAARAEMALLRTNFDPRRKAHESYELTVETEEVATLWRVDGWRLELEPEATMEHRLGRVRPITQSIEIALGGTILVATEAQIVTGGRVITLTLNGETWESGATFNAERQNIIDGLVSAQSEAAGWNATVVPALGVGDVVRTSATVVTVTLPAVGGYSITVNETVASDVPDAAIVTNPSSVTAPRFTITA